MMVAWPVSQYFTRIDNSRRPRRYGRRYWVIAIHCRLVAGGNDGIVQHYFVQNQLTDALPGCPRGVVPVAYSLEPMKFYQSILALFLAGFMAVAHAAPDTAADGEADPIARFASPGEEAAGDLLLQAMSLIGVAYRFGGSNPESGLDCSGFIQYVFKKSLRVNLPRTSASMAQVGREIDRDELKAGDLVFFNTRGFRYSHVGMYLGNNKFIHAPRTGKSIEVVNMTQSYWATRYNGARRVARAGMPVAAAEVEKPASSVAAAGASKRSYRKVEAADTEQRSVKGKKKKNARDDAPVAKGKKGKKAEQGSSARSKKKAGAEDAVSKKSSKKSSKSSDGAKKKAPVKKKKD